MVIDIRRKGVVIPAVVQNTKQGLVFVLRRDNGLPMFGVQEKPVPTRCDAGRMGFAHAAFSECARAAGAHQGA